jgi:hypothetical protein
MGNEQSLPLESGDGPAKAGDSSVSAWLKAGGQGEINRPAGKSTRQWISLPMKEDRNTRSARACCSIDQAAGALDDDALMRKLTSTDFRAMVGSSRSPNGPAGQSPVSTVDAESKLTTHLWNAPRDHVRVPLGGRTHPRTYDEALRMPSKPAGRRGVPSSSSRSPDLINSLPRSHTSGAHPPGQPRSPVSGQGPLVAGAPGSAADPRLLGPSAARSPLGMKVARASPDTQATPSRSLGQARAAAAAAAAAATAARGVSASPQAGTLTAEEAPRPSGRRPLRDSVPWGSQLLPGARDGPAAPADRGEGDGVAERPDAAASGSGGKLGGLSAAHSPPPGTVRRALHL